MKRPKTVEVSNTPRNRRGIFMEASSGMVSVELNMTLAIMITMPGPSMLMAVPAMVWSAPRLTVAIACSMPKKAPARPPQRKPIQGLPVK